MIVITYLTLWSTTEVLNQKWLSKVSQPCIFHVLCTAVFLHIRYLQSEWSALRWRLVLHCSKNNVHKLKNRYKFTWFIAAKIRKSEVQKSRDRCTSNLRFILFSLSLSLSDTVSSRSKIVFFLKSLLQYAVVVLVMKDPELD
jgi:hypothetical protein